MIGPKFDARTYALLILAAVGTLVVVNLSAQQQQQTGALTSTADVANATREVATATEQVAQSNQQIATAISELASAVREVKTSLDKQAEAQQESAQAEAAGTPEGEGGETNAEQTPESSDEGVFELE